MVKSVYSSIGNYMIILFNTMPSSLTSKFRSSIQLGYSLIEIMIGIAIISILVVIALPNYYQYIAKARESSCLSEVKSYSNNVFTILNDQDEDTITKKPDLSACVSITDATGWTLATQQKILATAKSPSNARIECDISNGTPCIVLP